jgi:hypothetical protein
MSPVAPTNTVLPLKQNCSSCQLEVQETYIALSGVLQRCAEPPHPTNWPIRDRAGEPDLITLSITSPFTTYTTTIELGNSFPTSFIPDPSPQAAVQAPQKPSTPGISTGTIVGIVVGCSLGFLLLIGVFYVYLLRARQYRLQKKRRGRSKSRSSSGRSGGGVSMPFLAK